MARAMANTDQEISFKDYLIEHYPVGRNYLEPLTGEFGQLHETKLHSGGTYVHVDGFGNPDMRDAFLTSLNGLPNHIVRQAIDEVRQWDFREPKGETLLRVLDYFQYQERYEGRGYSVVWLAGQLSVSIPTVYRWLDEVCRLIERESWRLYRAS